MLTTLLFILSFVVFSDADSSHKEPEPAPEPEEPEPDPTENPNNIALFLHHRETQRNQRILQNRPLPDKSSKGYLKLQRWREERGPGKKKGSRSREKQ